MTGANGKGGGGDRKFFKACGPREQHRGFNAHDRNHPRKYPSKKKIPQNGCIRGYLSVQASDRGFFCEKTGRTGPNINRMQTLRVDGDNMTISDLFTKPDKKKQKKRRFNDSLQKPLFVKRLQN